MQSEVWRSIPSQPDLLASSEGRLMVIPHRGYGGRPTLGQWDGNRYIYARRGFKTLKVARLICEAFHGEPKDRQVCMHLNEDSMGNRPENLRWGSQKENLNAPGFIAYCRSRTGDQSPTRKSRSRRLDALINQEHQPLR